MPWSNGGGRQTPQHNDIEALLKRSQDKFKQVMPGGTGLPGSFLFLITGAIAAIIAFQKSQFGRGDGLADPGKQTLQELNRLASDPGARPVPAPDLDPKLQALEDIPLVRSWDQQALMAVNGVVASVKSGRGLAGVDPIVQAALAGHFKITASTPAAGAHG